MSRPLGRCFLAGILFWGCANGSPHIASVDLENVLPRSGTGMAKNATQSRRLGSQPSASATPSGASSANAQGGPLGAAVWALFGHKLVSEVSVAAEAYNRQAPEEALFHQACGFVLEAAAGLGTFSTPLSETYPRISEPWLRVVVPVAGQFERFAAERGLRSVNVSHAYFIIEKPRSRYAEVDALPVRPGTHLTHRCATTHVYADGTRITHDFVRTVMWLAADSADSFTGMCLLILEQDSDAERTAADEGGGGDTPQVYLAFRLRYSYGDGNWALLTTTMGLIQEFSTGLWEGAD